MNLQPGYLVGFRDESDAFLIGAIESSSHAGYVVRHGEGSHLVGINDVLVPF